MAETFYIQTKVAIDTRGADRLLEGLDDLATGRDRGGAFGTLIKQWGVRVSAFGQRRFRDFSRGGGNWAPLALSTIERRQKARRPSKTNPFALLGGKKDGTGARSSLARDTKRGGKLVSAGRTISVLIDSGRLYGALGLNQPGNLFRRVPGGIEFGIEGGKGSGSGVTIGDIARFHHNGGKHLPRRRVVDVPDQATAEGMSSDLARAIERSMGGGS